MKKLLWAAFAATTIAMVMMALFAVTTNTASNSATTTIAENAILMAAPDDTAATQANWAIITVKKTTDEQALNTGPNNLDAMASQKLKAVANQEVAFRVIMPI